MSIGIIFWDVILGYRKKFSSQNIVRNMLNVPKYHTKGHEQVYKKGNVQGTVLRTIYGNFQNTF